MRRLTIVILLTLLWLPSLAQVVTRAEFAPYTLRKDAEAKVHSSTDSYIEFIPKAISSSFGFFTREQQIEVPQSWVDAQVFLHIENVGSAYTLSINGKQVIKCDDSFTPTTYNISPYLGVGLNTLSIVTRSTSLPQLEQGVSASQRTPLEGSYLFVQNKLRIVDYTQRLEEHQDKLGAQLHLEVIVENGFNYPEQIEVGFDVYDPAGQLVDFSTSKLMLEGGARDTIRFAPHLYGAAKYKWGVAQAAGMQVIGRPTTRLADQQLYSVMLFTKRNRVSSDYIPFSVGYIIPEYSSSGLSSCGEMIKLNTTTYSALGSAEQCEAELRSIVQQGFNGVVSSVPQPIWFYSICDKLGLYVVEQIAINAPDNANDRSVGGTASNDPKLVAEYLERAKKSYYRTRNFSCVVAYSLGGGNSGNGYNMYKAYQWLKSVEPNRAVIYSAAGGEWNDDAL